MDITPIVPTVSMPICTTQGSVLIPLETAWDELITKLNARIADDQLLASVHKDSYTITNTSDKSYQCGFNLHVPTVTLRLDFNNTICITTDNTDDLFKSAYESIIDIRARGLAHPSVSIQFLVTKGFSAQLFPDKQGQARSKDLKGELAVGAACCDVDTKCVFLHLYIQGYKGECTKDNTDCKNGTVDVEMSSTTEIN